MHLCTLASVRWAQIEAAYYQVDLLSLRMTKFLNLVYAWAVERVPHDKYDEWHEQLLELLDWQDIDSDAAVQLESDSFMKLQGLGG